MLTKVSDLIAEYLEERGIRHVFGIIGAGNAHIFDSITQRGFTEIVCVHHEQAACMAMQTYFRTSGIITAAILTTGGGSTNATTGVVGAWADSIPGVVISGNENSRYTRSENPLRMWGVQGYDSSGMVQGVTKFHTRTMEPLSTIRDLEEAFHTARTGRPGPCWVDIPMDIQAMRVEPGDLLHFEPSDQPATDSSVTENDIQSVLAALQSAERPVLWLGHGIRLAGAVDQIEPLLETLGVPALVSWAGIDMVSSDHPLVYGRAGVYGQRAANFVLQNCDFLLCIGTRLAVPQVGYDLSELARAAKIVVVDVDPAEVKKLGDRVSQTICADAKVFLEQLLCSAKKVQCHRPEQWIATCDQYRNSFPWVGPEHDDKNGFINSYKFLDRLADLMKPDQHVVTDMGTALLSGHQVMKFRDSQRLMTSTGLGEMGFGLPAAIGVSFARDCGEVLCLNCDGGMMMNLQELQTIAHHKLPIKIVVFNNDGYLMIKHTQKALFKGHYSGTDRKSGVSCPDFSKIAAAFNMPSYVIRTWEDCDSVLPAMLAADGPVICEVFMDPEQLFVPKLSLATQPDGTLVSPPLEDLSPFIDRSELARNMIVGVHEKSNQIVP